MMVKALQLLIVIVLSLIIAGEAIRMAGKRDCSGSIIYKVT